LAGHWESRKAFVQALWQAPPKVIIEDRDTAVKIHDYTLSKDLRETPLTLYTDGRGIEGRIGAVDVDLKNPYTHS
jgi:hypothetical protein